jgi:hypothetical protein
MAVQLRARPDLHQQAIEHARVMVRQYEARVAAHPAPLGRLSAAERREVVQLEHWRRRLERILANTAERGAL